MRRQIRPAVHRLTRRIARAFTGLIDRNGPEVYPPNTPGSPPTFSPNPGNTPTDPEPSIMAEGEEDYSSLPLTDRWVHKVCGTHDPTGFRPHGYSADKTGGGAYLLEAARSLNKDGMLTAACLIVDLESPQSSIRRSHQAVRDQRRRVRCRLPTVSARLFLVERRRRRQQRGSPTRWHGSLLRVSEIRWQGTWHEIKRRHSHTHL